ncbi:MULTISPECIES: M24 family metallopeptidase [Haloferax]|uniref:M24 family metallopeptidase n=1 Tax=Haloferax marinum TaxID=2666143 RepID=A0A6A8G5M1_9EURY|nr:MULTISPECIES: M24 family metallopeptidase [Haloferax]KAB1197349.1 M24 family metallopeptidase [Haloferax sp. CBA1150]MRW96391.1 M24 family metallopeptidase [Haloferax marinum]
MPPGPRGGDAIDAAIDDSGAIGFVSVCRGDDPTSRYLTGLDAEFDVVYVRLPGETHLRVPSTVDIPDGDAASIRVDDRPAGQAAAAVLAAQAETGTVLTPQTVPHDAALHLESAGYELSSTTAVQDARATKDAAELDAIEGVQRAAKRAISAAAVILADAHVEDEALVWSDAPLSTERIRRQVNATLAVEGVDSAGATTVTTGTRGGRESAVELVPGEPIVVSVSPRGPTGYRGALARTFVVDADGGWERRAHVACAAARDVALVEADPGADAGFVGSEIRAETAAFGFSMADEVTRDVGGGLGLSAREDPPLDGDAELATGNVLRVRSAITHATHGRVELTDVLVVEDDGPRYLTDAPTTLDPSRWTE